MSLTLNAASADVDLSLGDAKARVTPGTRIVVGNLTKGFDITAIEDRGQQPGEALSAVGRVGATGSPAGWQIGFVQICKLNAGQVYYAGRIRSEGSIAVMFERAMPAQVLLDSLADRTPWTRLTDRFKMTGNQITSPTGDHPAVKVPQKLRNSGRNVDNFLFHMIDDREFWSIFTAIDPTGKRTSLAHFHWKVRYEAKLTWNGGRPTVQDSSHFDPGSKAKGAPSEPELQSLIGNPVGPQFNDAAAAAMKTAFLGARGPNRTENDTWFLNVPAGFYQ
jgi:hypothetical protein